VCVVVGKTTVAEYSVVKELTRDLLRVFQTFPERVFVRLRASRYEGQPPPVTWLASRSLARAPCERRLVENTGLEPVTSWLQTRRSPS
jgi:hypothetical protein